MLGWSKIAWLSHFYFVQLGSFQPPLIQRQLSEEPFGGAPPQRPLQPLLPKRGGLWALRQGLEVSRSKSGTTWQSFWGLDLVKIGSGYVKALFIICCFFKSKLIVVLKVMLPKLLKAESPASGVSAKDFYNWLLESETCGHKSPLVFRVRKGARQYEQRDMAQNGWHLFWKGECDSSLYTPLPLTGLEIPFLSSSGVVKALFRRHKKWRDKTLSLIHIWRCRRRG